MKKILYILPEIPYKGIDHAGGQFLYEYLKKISLTHFITILAPGDKINKDKLKIASKDFKIILTESLQITLKNQFNRIKNVYYEPISHSYEKLFIKKIKELNLLEVTDIVEIHYSQLMRLIPMIKKQKEKLPIFFYSHDIYYQSIERILNSKNISFIEKLIYKIKNLNIRKKEAYYLNQADLIFTFSKKDCDLLTKIGVTTNKKNVVLLPTIHSEKSHIESDYINLIFVGAFKRAPNFQGALWFLKEIWPDLNKKFDNIKVYFVGSNPTKEMLSYESDKIKCTGYVDDLDYYYRIADIVIVPLFLGAGVKFKVLHSFYFELPVVSTSVGAEGIDKDAFAAIADNPQEFINSIEMLIYDRKLRKTIGQKARKILDTKYNFLKNTIEVVLQAYENIN